MGFKVLNILVKGKSPEVICKELLLTQTGRYEEIPEAPITGMNLSNGDYLLSINYGIPNEKLLAKLSKNASLITCYVHEGVMISFASEWVNGIQQWSVLHDSNTGDISHLAIGGTPPTQLATIQEALQTQQTTSEDGAI